MIRIPSQEYSYKRLVQVHGPTSGENFAFLTCCPTACRRGSCSSEARKGVEGPVWVQFCAWGDNSTQPKVLQAKVRGARLPGGLSVRFSASERVPGVRRGCQGVQWERGTP
jgi:hypothetical protein